MIDERKNDPPPPGCKRSRPLPYYNPISTGSLPSTIAPPDHPLYLSKLVSFHLYLVQVLLSHSRGSSYCKSVNAIGKPQICSRYAAYGSPPIMSLQSIRHYNSFRKNIKENGRMNVSLLFSSCRSEAIFFFTTSSRRFCIKLHCCHNIYDCIALSNFVYICGESLVLLLDNIQSCPGLFKSILLLYVGPFPR